LLALAPAPQTQDAAAHDRRVETWLAQAHAYLAAAEPVPQTTPAVSAGAAQDALKAALQQPGTRLQPNSAWCFVCGLRNPVGLKMRFLQAGPGKAVAYAVVPEAYQGYPGVVHGGIVAALLDEVTGRAGTGTDPEHARLFYTARLSIRYRRHVPIQRLLRLEGALVRDRGRFYEAQGAIYDAASDQVLAQADALLAEVAAEELAQMNPAALGWRIYPLEECES
ncbi:MAG: PaaI family thioesterase, partial [Chloroflexi bacterium]|nr:PaaI family thioesterase [Chloroflexota bacterium]